MKIIKELEKQLNIDKKDMNLRLDGRVEWICDHGVGHTIWVPEDFRSCDAWWQHTCDGCCLGLNLGETKNE